MRSPFMKLVAAAALVAAASACASKNPDAPAPKSRTGILTEEGGINVKLGSGISIGGSGNSKSNPAGIGVNSFLWRASLDTLSFMPLASVDPFGGVIITDWYADPAKPEERFKATVYILDTRLRADGLKVSVFRQTKTPTGTWQDASVDPDTGSEIENAILNAARKLKITTAGK